MSIYPEIHFATVKILLIIGVCLLFIPYGPLQALENSEIPFGKPIKEIRFIGLKRTKEYIFQRELLSKISELCLEENLDLEHQNLELLDIFSRIDIKPVVDQGGKGILLHLGMFEKPVMTRRRVR